VTQERTRANREFFTAESERLAALCDEMALRFLRGGRLLAVGEESDARHVAVEFVHPVIAGARALPAVALIEVDPTDTLRAMARSDDVLVVIGSADAIDDGLLRRAEAWGLTSVWLGAGTRPTTRGADHSIWLDDDPVALIDGRIVLGYHVLWELTHVCFEHPGLLDGERGAPDDGADVCTTCSDEGRLVEVVEIVGGANDVVIVRAGDATETVNTALVGPVRPGDLVLVHAGTAIATVDV
jgi:hypothetical protein